MRDPLSRSIAVLAIMLTAGGGCGVIRRPAAPLPHRPYLVHLPGVGGEMWFHRDFVRAIRAGGFDAETDIYDWCGRQFPIAALRDYDDNRAKAKKLADRLAARYRAHPDRPLYLTGESGGAGMIVWTLEQLPQDVSIEGVVLLAAAVSPGYDLSPALRRVRGKMFVFSSPLDVVVLGLGTSLFGTMDGKHTPSAGCVGFGRPRAADPEQYAKIDASRYDGRWLWRYGYLGSHHDAVGARFASGFIAPLLVSTALEAQPRAASLPATRPAPAATPPAAPAEPVAAAGRGGGT